MSKISFPDFWKFYKGTPNQKEAIVLLESQLPISLLADEAAWVQLYRKPEDKPLVTKLTPDAPYSQQVTEHFTYSELTLNEPARRFTNQGQCDIATEICEFLETARNKFGSLKITSGHRPPSINAAVGGASSSEHLFQAGCGAVDVYPINGDGVAFENWCDKEWPFSVGYGMAYRGFVHLGIREGRPRVRWDY